MTCFYRVAIYLSIHIHARFQNNVYRRRRRKKDGEEEEEEEEEDDEEESLDYTVN